MTPPISYENVYLDAGGRQRAPRPTRPSARHGPADIAGGQAELDREARQSRGDAAHHQPGITHLERLRIAAFSSHSTRTPSLVAHGRVGAPRNMSNFSLRIRGLPRFVTNS